MYNLLFFNKFDWTPTMSAWGAWDIPSPYRDEEREGYILPDGWQEHMAERGINFIVIETQEQDQTDE